MNRQGFDSIQTNRRIDSFSDLRTEKNANFNPLDDKVNLFETKSTFRIPGKLNLKEQTGKYVAMLVIFVCFLISIIALVLAGLALSQKQKDASASALSSQGYKNELHMTKVSLETVSKKLSLMEMKMQLAQNETLKWKNEMLAWKKSFPIMPTGNYSANGAILHSLKSLQQKTSLLQSNSTNLQQEIQRFQIYPWPYNGYIYRLTPRQSWQNARRTCQSFGGDLAVFGIKDYITRITIADSLRIDHAWVGLRDPHSNGMWEWNDNSRAESGDIRWNTGEPNNHLGTIEDCGDMAKSQNWKMNDNVCRNSVRGICEIEFQSFQSD